MLGLFGIFSPISAEIGVNRSMSLNPRINSTRGYLKDIDMKASDATNLFSVGELLNGFTPTHADAPRVIMATTQNKHITPTKRQTPSLIGSGVDKALAYMLGQTFAYKATDDGTVTKIDKDKNLVFLKYKNGETAAIDIEAKSAKNSGGGFYIETRLDLTSKVKVGYKFKKGEILAKDKSFFKEMQDGSTGFASGSLRKMALMSLPETFEDSSVVTQTLVDDLSSDVINKRDVALKVNSRILKMVNIGDEVEVNDSLVVFEETGDDEKLAIAALEKLDTDTQTTIEELARSKIKAKFSGTIFDIRIYYNTPLEEMHPTLRKVVDAYVEKYNVKAEMLKETRSDEIVHLPSTSMIESDKILGNEINGVLIEFYIKHVDKFKVGDKCTFYTSLKTIVAETIPEGQEPYSEYDDGQEVSCFLSPMSFVSRMTVDLFLMGYSNKVLLDLKQKCLKRLNLK